MSNQLRGSGMSGGHFDYVQFRIEDVADDLKSYIDRCESGEKMRTDMMHQPTPLKH